MMGAIAILFPTVMILLYIVLWKNDRYHGFIVYTASITFAAIYSRSLKEIMFIIFLVALPFVSRHLFRVMRRHRRERERARLLELEDKFTHEMSEVEKDFFYRSLPDRFYWLKDQLKNIRSRLVELAQIGF